ncbi:MAG: putative salt-induced outer membrane protein YdiY [Pirellulaceae bacterium]|jgi:putative salt-induced outer membrane protein YdiY
MLAIIRREEPMKTYTTFDLSRSLGGGLLTLITCLVCADLAAQDLYRLPPISQPTPNEVVPQPHLLPAAVPALSDVSIPSATDVVEVHEPWYYPSAWYDETCWEASFEVGVNGSEGNAQTASTRAGANLKRVSDSNDLTFDMIYNRASAAGVETQHNAFLSVDRKWKFGDSRWSLFDEFGLTYDEFKPFDLRVTFDFGVSYDFIKTDITNLAGRFGGGVSHEIGGPDDSWVPQALFGMDYERKFTSRQKFRMKVDYLPAWGDFTDYRIELDTGWEMLIDEEANLSLKLSVIDRYDSTPNGAKHNDLNYALLLLWKM